MLVLGNLVYQTEKSGKGFRINGIICTFSSPVKFFWPSLGTAGSWRVVMKMKKNVTKMLIIFFSPFSNKSELTNFKKGQIQFFKGVKGHFFILKDN